MKFSTTLALSAAPLAMAKAVHNVYPAKRDAMMAPRKPQLGALALELEALGLSGLGITSNAATEVIIVWVNPGAGALTTTVNPLGAGVPAATGAAGLSAAPLASGAAAAPGAAQTHQVMVGGNAGLAYTPSQINAAVGDMVVFTFMSANHTATQSTFAEPCVAMPGGMDSGFQVNANNSVNPPPQVAMQVMVDTPLWFYCRQKGHCGKGMTFSINPTAAKTQAMFQSMAISQNGTGAGSAITGGTSGSAASNSTGSAAGSATGSAAGSASTGSVSSGSSSTGSSTGATTGVGSLQNGQCMCAVTCSSGSLPAANVQGVGAFGGMAGSLPMAMSEPVMNAAIPA